MPGSPTVYFLTFPLCQVNFLLFSLMIINIFLSGEICYILLLFVAVKNNGTINRKGESLYDNTTT